MRCDNAIKIYNKDLLQIEKIYASQDGDKTIIFADSILTILSKQKLQNCEVGLWFLYYKSGGLELIDKFEMALDNYYSIIRESEKQKLSKLEASSYISIARIHEYIGRSKDCLRSLGIAKKLIDDNAILEIESRYAVRYASYHRGYGQTDSTRIYALRAIELGKKYNVLRSQADGYLLLAMVTEDEKESIEYFSNAAKIFYQYGDYIGAGYMMYNISVRHKKNRLFKKSIAAADTALLFIQPTTSKNHIYNNLTTILYQLKNEIYLEENKLDSAYLYLAKVGEYKDKSKWILNNEEVEQNAVEFAVEKEKLVSDGYREILNLQVLAVSVLGILLILLIGLLASNKKKTKLIKLQNEEIRVKNNELEASVDEQATLLTEVHHRVKNNLQLVISLLTLYGNQQKYKSLLAVFEDLAGKVRSISLIHEQLYSKGIFDKLYISEYIKDISSYYQQLQNSNTELEYQFDFDEIFLNIETAFPIGIITTELLSNSLKYALVPNQTLKAKISLKYADGKYTLTYKDNGPGYPKESSNASGNQMGLTLIKNMVRQLQAESNLYNENGAVFIMIFQEKKISII